VVLTPEEISSAAPGRSKTIDVTAFVELSDIDPVYFDKPYYLAQAAKGAERAYALLAEVMASADRAAIASFVLREKQYLVAVRAEHRVLVLQTLHFSDEVRQPTAVVDSLPEAIELETRELEIARLLVDSMATEWRPEQYIDTYRTRVEELIEQRRNGTFVVADDPGPAPAPVLNLLDALQASMDALPRHGQRTKRAAVSSTRSGSAGAGGKPTTEGDEGRGGTRADLLRRAGELGIAGRSKMSREDLEAAIATASRGSRRAS
jgi:DNA end-binding protein Ku